ncbi:MAG: flavin reductase family protein [Chloroflexi bacterium]|nr:flavin reductase family protein [Chloroflexota bacterium]
MTDSDPSAGISKAVYGLLAVGSLAEDGSKDVMTANWGSQISFEPRLYAIAVQSDSHTAANIKSTGVFSINFMPGGTHDLALKFAAHSTSGEGRLEGVEFATHETGAPILKAAVGWIECRVLDSNQPGDHTVFFGEVIDGGEGPAEGDPTTLAAIDLSYAG